MEKIREQILAIRDTGRTNMLDLPVVQAIAYEMEFFELVNLIEENPRQYIHFIFTGKFEE